MGEKRFDGGAVWEPQTLSKAVIHTVCSEQIGRLRAPCEAMSV